MKKICFITTTYITYRCFLKDFSIFLHNTGEFEIFLICGYDKTILTDVPDFVKVIQIPMKRGIDFAIWRPVIRLCSIFSKENFDLIQYSTPNAAFYASVAGWLCNTKNRLYCQWGIRYMGFSGWKRVLFQWIEKITCRCSTQIETESFQLRNFALKEGLYNDRKSFVTGSGSACGVNLQKYDRSKRESWRQEIRHTLKIGNNETVFVFAGRLTADKGINELLEAFLLLREEHEKIRLIVAGGMDHYHSLNQGLFSKAVRLPALWCGMGKCFPLNREPPPSASFAPPTFKAPPLNFARETRWSWSATAFWNRSREGRS